MSLELPAWALEMAGVVREDEPLPSSIDDINIPLNRRRLAAFLAAFESDQDVRDFLALDVLAVNAGLNVTSTGLAETEPGLALRPFRIWEYVWLYKGLKLGAGGLSVLDLGGPASHLSVMAALAGCQVTSLDINPEFVEAAQVFAHTLNLSSLNARVGDMRDLSAFPDASFDAVVCCSVLEHLTADDQMRALQEVARVLKPRGTVGLTFDFGAPAPGANIHLPPPHDPPRTASDALRRYLQGDLALLGNAFREDPIPGSLFHSEAVRYTVAALFLARPPLPPPPDIRSRDRGSNIPALRIPAFAYRLYQRLSLQQQAAAAKETSGLMDALRREIEIRDLALEDARRQLTRAVAAVNQEHGQAEVLAGAADERLAGWREADLAVQSLASKLDPNEATAAELRSELQRMAALLEQETNQRRVFETASRERLIALERNERSIVELRSQLDAAITTMGRQNDRARMLETAAQERLDELHRKDAALTDLRRQLVEAVATVHQQHEGARVFETAAQERLEELHRKDAALTDLRSRLALAEQTIQQQNQQIGRAESALQERLADLQKKLESVQARAEDL